VVAALIHPIFISEIWIFQNADAGIFPIIFISPCISEISHSSKKDAGSEPET